MKLKKVMVLCNKSKKAYLMDRLIGDETVEQWLGDGRAVYRLEGMPYLEEDHLVALFDIPEKALDKWSIRRQEASDSINFNDTDTEERFLAEPEISVIYDGETLQPLETRYGIIFIQSEYLAPLEDV